MKVISTPIQDLLIIELQAYKDERGFFCERFQNSWITKNFVQDNMSRSSPGVLRGLHSQKNPEQAKLVSCLSGKIFDVAVDARKESPTFGKWYGIELSGDPTQDGKIYSLLIPEGFLHGFCVLGHQPADVYYKVSGSYNANGEYGARYDDPDLNIKWPVKPTQVSTKDLGLPPFSSLSA